MKFTNVNAATQAHARRVIRPRKPPKYDSRIHGLPGYDDDDPPAGSDRFAAVRADQWPIDILLGRLDYYTTCGNGYSARCPAHADHEPSLSITETADGTLLLKCFATCSTEKVLSGVGLKLSHLYPSEYARRFGRREDGRPVSRSGTVPRAAVVEANHGRMRRKLAAYRVDDDEEYMPLCLGTGLCVRACREFHVGVKGERYVFPERDDQGRPVGMILRSLSGEKRCLTGSVRGLTLPVVDRGFGGPVYVTEGASDALRLHGLRVRAVGRPAATPSATAFGWLAAYLTATADAEGVVVLGDNDPADASGRRVGREEAKELATRLTDALPPSVPVSWALPRKGFKDVREQANAGDWDRGLRVREVRA